MARGTKKNGVPGSGAAVGVGSGVRRVVVGAEVSLGLDDAAGENAGGGAMDEKLAEKARGYLLRRGLEKGSGEWVPGKS
jgi:hypothetical protein